MASKKIINPLTVIGGAGFIRGKQYRIIVATKTKKRACELFIEARVIHNKGYFDRMFCATGNPLELEVARSKPETVLFCDLNAYGVNRVFTEVPK